MAITANSLQKNFIQVLRRTMDSAWWGKDVTGIAKAPLILNAETADAVNAAGTGLVKLIGCDSSNNVTLPSGANVLTGQALTINSGASLIAGAGATVNLTGATLTGAASLVQTATVALSSADILHASGILKALVAAPGVGLAIFPLWLLLEMTCTSTAYANGGAVSPVYHGATAALTGNTVPATVVNGSVGTTYTLLSLGAQSNGLTLTANTGIDLYSGTAFITGTGTASVQIGYITLTL